jgi:hypothetical protein
MPAGYTDAQIKDELNRSMAAASRARLGDVIYDLMNNHNALVAQFQAFLTHVDTAAVTGIGTANEATYGAGLITITLPAERTYPQDT